MSSSNLLVTILCAWKLDLWGYWRPIPGVSGASFTAWTWTSSTPVTAL